MLPADILGQVYEQFLGKVIRLTAGHQAKVEDKPEVKKAGGVFYTPTYIVEYIVKNTVGKLLEGKHPGDVGVGQGDPAPRPRPRLRLGLLPPRRLPVPARLVPRLLRRPTMPEKWAKSRQPALYQAAGGEWRLTTAERKRILLDHIYGVDIDPQAVEVTKLSLLLKVLEGESRADAGAPAHLLGRARPARPGRATSSAATRSSARTTTPARARS